MGARVPWVDVHDELQARISHALFERSGGEIEEGTGCFECGRPIGYSGRWYSDCAVELVPYCAGCAEGEFGPA